MFASSSVIIRAPFTSEDLVSDKIMAPSSGPELPNSMLNILISSCVRSDGDIKSMHHVVLSFKGRHC